MKQYLTPRNLFLVGGIAALAIAGFYSQGWNRGFIVAGGIALLVAHLLKPKP